MSYHLNVRFDRELSDDVALIDTDDPKALVRQFTKELQAAFDCSGMAGLFRVETIKVNGTSTIINPIVES